MGEEAEEKGELEDYTSLAFERALENSGGKNSRYNSWFCFWRAFLGLVWRFFWCHDMRGRGGAGGLYQPCVERALENSGGKNSRYNSCFCFLAGFFVWFGGFFGVLMGEEAEEKGELEDYTSLAFERALENSGGKNSRCNSWFCFWRAFFGFGLAVFIGVMI
jgi:hypothetical protein